MKNTITKVLTLVLVLIVALSMVACGNSSTPGEKEGEGKGEEGSPVDISIAHNSTDVSPWEKGVQAGIKHLKEASDGKFNATSYPGGTLFQGNWEILLEMTQTNSIQIGVEAISALSSLNGDANFLCLPFMFQDNTHVDRFLNSGNKTWDNIISSFEDEDIIILGVAPRPMRQISNNLRPVNKLEDLKGLILRSPANNTIIATMEALGIKAVPLSSGEIYSSIQLGTVNGEDNSLAQQYDAKTYEVIDHFTILNYIADGSAMFMSKEAWDACTKEEQAMFMEMGKMFANTTYAEDEAYFEVAKEAVTKSGVKITEMSNEEKERCAEACSSVYDEFKKNFPEEKWNDVMSAVESTKK